MTYGSLTRRTASDKMLCDKAFTIAKNSKYNEYFLIKKLPVDQLKMKICKQRIA